MHDDGFVHGGEDVFEPVFADAAVVFVGKDVGEVVDALEIFENADKDCDFVLPVGDLFEDGGNVFFGITVVVDGIVEEREIAADAGSVKYGIDDGCNGGSVAVIGDGSEHFACSEQL